MKTLAKTYNTTAVRYIINEAAKTTVKTGAVISYQSFGDLVRSNPHYHCIFLEGGIVKHKHLIRYYGLYSSRTKGKAVKDGGLAKFGYKVTPERKTSQNPEHEMETVSAVN